MKPPHYSGTFDEYAKQLLRQNQNLPCAHCGSSLGHYARCPLISRDAAELASTQPIAELEHNEAVARDKEIRHNDEYAKQLALQQQGIPCAYCSSTWGHKVFCCLLNGGVERGY